MVAEAHDKAYEAIEIAKKFCSESSGKFINGILNSIAKESREIKR